MAHARNLIDDVEWSAMDATTINLPDTMGYAVPDEHFEMFRTIIESVPDADKAISSVHCYNDLGLAVANSLAGVADGALWTRSKVRMVPTYADGVAAAQICHAIDLGKGVQPQ